MSFNYVTGLPNPPNLPSTDVGSMQTNTNSIFNIMGVNHVGFNNGNAGKHTFLQLPNPQGSPPVTPGPQELAFYTDVTSFGNPTNTIDWRVRLPSNGNTAILLRTGVGGGTPFINNTNGYTQMFGGLIFQWGIITNNTRNTYIQLNFTDSPNNINFPNNIWGVFFTVIGITGGGGSGIVPSGNANIGVVNVIKTGFQWCNISDSSKYTGFYWCAIGN